MQGDKRSSSRKWAQKTKWVGPGDIIPHRDGGMSPENLKGHSCRLTWGGGLGRFSKGPRKRKGNHPRENASEMGRRSVKRGTA